MTEERYFSISIETWGAGVKTIADDTVVELSNLLGELGAEGASTSAGGLAGGLGATFGIYALDDGHPSTWSSVTNRGLEIFEAACEKLGLTQGIARVDVMGGEYLDRELDREPETYLGVTEVARELGVSRQRVSELRTSIAFPAPVAEIAAGPVWRGSSLKRFIDTWERKPGRPRKVRSGLERSG